MELFLNFLWVLIAVFGLSVWRVCWAPERSGRRAPLQEWTAIVAALVFLFFAVSLSDDLHSDLVLEESASGRRQTMALASAHSAPEGVKHTSPAAVAGDIVLPQAWFPTFQCIGSVNIFDQALTAYHPSGRPSGRAPPTSAL
jgi:hypothetical protein